MPLFARIGTRIRWSGAIPIIIAMGMTACTGVNTGLEVTTRTEIQKPASSGQPTYTPLKSGPSTRTPYEAPSRNLDPYCNPPETRIWVVPSSTSIGVGEQLQVDLILRNKETSDAFMGQIQYRLDILPNLFVGGGLLESDKTLYPGESDTASFVLTGTMEGTAELIAKASYELHAVDLSSGSWTGCESHPLIIDVVAGQGAPSVQDNSVKLHPPSTRTGIQSVDNVLEAVLARDQEAFLDMIHYTVSACTIEMGLGGPPKCREGETEGTKVEVLPFLGPEGHFLRKEEIENWDGLDVEGLYAVYLVSEKAYTDPDYPAGEYAAVFLHGHGVSYVTLQIDDRGIVRIDNDFGYPPDEQLLRDASKIILPPIPRQ